MLGEGALAVADADGGAPEDGEAEAVGPPVDVAGDADGGADGPAPVGRSVSAAIPRARAATRPTTTTAVRRAVLGVRSAGRPSGGGVPSCSGGRTSVTAGFRTQQRSPPSGSASWSWPSSVSSCRLVPMVRGCGGRGQGRRAGSVGPSSPAPVHGPGPDPFGAAVVLLGDEALRLNRDDTALLAALMPVGDAAVSGSRLGRRDGLAGARPGWGARPGAARGRCADHGARRPHALLPEHPDRPAGAARPGSCLSRAHRAVTGLWDRARPAVAPE